MKDKRETLNEDLGDSIIPQGDNVRWAEYMWELTPVEQKSDTMWYKREDKFAPHGINGINGSKCRQLLHLFDTMSIGKKRVIHATNVNSSPQTPMTAVMAEHYGLECIQVAGGSSFESLSKLHLPIFATMFGTIYDIECRSGFNVGIQKRVRELLEDYDDRNILFWILFGLTLLVFAISTIIGLLNGDDDIGWDLDSCQEISINNLIYCELEGDTFYYMAFGRLIGQSKTQLKSRRIADSFHIHSLSDLKKCPKFSTKTQKRNNLLDKLGI